MFLFRDGLLTLMYIAWMMEVCLPLYIGSPFIPTNIYNGIANMPYQSAQYSTGLRKCVLLSNIWKKNMNT